KSLKGPTYSGESTESSASDTNLSSAKKKKSYSMPNEGFDDSTLDMDDDDETQDVDSCTQDYDESQELNSSQDMDSSDTCVLFSQNTKSQSVLATDHKISKMSARVIVKAITSKVLGRYEMVKLLKGKFQVPSQSLTALAVSELTEILARKFIDKKYVVITEGADYGNLKTNQLSVQKELEV
ncbi:hypothetical protein AC249_AIPGENE6747, partial [Exaiptasia diaphana]